MSIVISNFAAISGYIAYCAAIGFGSYGITRWASNGFEINSKEDERKQIESDVNSAYVGFKYDNWKNENSILLTGLNDVESYNKFKESSEFVFDDIFDNMKKLSSYKIAQINIYQLKEFSDKSTLGNLYTNNDINSIIDSIEKTKKVFENDENINWKPNTSIYDAFIKSENLNTNLTGWSDMKPGQVDWSIMFQEYRTSIIEDLKNKNPNDIIFANENVLAIQNEMSIALNLSPKEKDLHKENGDLYQMLIDNKKVYDEVITTIEGKYNINEIDGFKVKYFETNKEIIDQIDKNIDKLQELENNKKEPEVKSIAD